MGLVALNPIRCGKVILIISIFDTLTHHLESLLGDGLALDLSTVGDKELGCAILIDIAGALQVQMYSLRALQTQSLRSIPSVWLCIAGTKMG